MKTEELREAELDLEAALLAVWQAQQCAHGGGQAYHLRRAAAFIKRAKGVVFDVKHELVSAEFDAE